MEDVAAAADKVKKKAKEGVELTKKQELNNHIVLMRKVVRAARVHLINKLTKEIKKLKQRKGDEKACSKAARKAERFLQEIQASKHLKEDRVSVYALQDTKTLEDVLQDTKSTPKDRVLARFSHHKLVQAEVKKYREKNPYWELQIPVLLEKNKDKRRKINKKLAEREVLLAQKLKQSGVKAVASASEENSNLEGDEEEEDESETSTDAEEDKVQPSNVVSNRQLQEKPSTKLDKTKGKKPNIPVQPRKELSISKSEGTVKVKVLKSLEDLEEPIEEEPLKVKITSASTAQLKSQAPKSSFFVGGEETEEPEDSRVFESRKVYNSGKSQQNSEFKPIFRKGKLINKPPPKAFNRAGPRPRDFNQGPKRQSNRYFEKQDSENTNLIPLGKQNQVSKQFDNNGLSKLSSAPVPTSTEKLHPSWEAKKRQQQSGVTEFKGKKIKFDED